MSDCKKCKKRTLKSYNQIVIPFSVYLLITSLVGTVFIIKYIMSLF